MLGAECPACAEVGADGEQGDIAMPVEPRPRNPKAALPAKPAAKVQPAEVAGDGLTFWNGYGGFDPQGRDYVVRLAGQGTTPHPWINVISNGTFGFHIASEGAGFTWSMNSRDYQLTPWSNDTVINCPGEGIYLHDLASKTVLSPFAALSTQDALLILVPRHPQRFDEVGALVERRGLRCARRSAWGGEPLPAAAVTQVAQAPLRPDVRVLLGDSMGELGAYYAASDVAFIGGSLLPLGGQNLIEACAVGVPVLIGPHVFNFAQATADAVASGAALQVADPSDLARVLDELFTDHARRVTMSAAAAAFAARHRGATERTVAVLEVLLPLALSEGALGG